MAKDYVLLKIDTDRHVNGAAVAARLRGERGGGIPWMVVTDASGTELVTSDAPEGNVGCPVTEAERAWFRTMLERTRRHMSDADLDAIAAELAAKARELGR